MTTDGQRRPSLLQAKPMQRDLRDTAEFHDVLDIVQRLLQPGTGRVVDAAEPEVTPEGRHALFAGTIIDALEGMPQSRICSVDLASGDLQVLTFGPNTDRTPKASPDGRFVAFRSDRSRKGDFQLFILDRATGAARPAPRVDGWVDYLHWSADGQSILLGVAGHGADLASTQGATATARAEGDAPSWTPSVETGDEAFRWRRLQCYDVACDRMAAATPSPLNIWEAAWCGPRTTVAVVSPGQGEGEWYEATLQLVDLETGASRPLHEPRDQLGWPAASPDCTRIAFVEALCSDRTAVVGDLWLIDLALGAKRIVDTAGVNVTHVEWRSDDALLVAGVRGLETVVGLYDCSADLFVELWGSRELSTAGHCPKVAGWGRAGDCVLVGEGFRTAPEIATIRGGNYRTVRSLDADYAELTGCIHSAEPVAWRAPDGLEVEGYLLLPASDLPRPLVMFVHGGPVTHWRPAYLGRGRPLALLLLRRGYAVFLPNPRGSSGRGQAFARHVIGDMGGADARDCLSGIDALVEKGIVDRRRLAVTGGSYGGFMSAWLITQDPRFAAAAILAPMTNFVSEYLTSNIPQFMRQFAADTYRDPVGQYHHRSPVMHAYKARTPALHVCGALDRCTPPEEAMQFHNALLENGVVSVLVTYPREGHGIRELSAMVDYCARVVMWFDAHLA